MRSSETHRFRDLRPGDVLIDTKLRQAALMLSVERVPPDERACAFARLTLRYVLTSPRDVRLETATVEATCHLWPGWVLL